MAGTMIGIGRRTADLAHTAHQRDVRIGAEHILAVLLRNIDGPRLILRPEVFGADEQQRQQQDHNSPQRHVADETSLAPHEKEKGQPDDAVNLDERADDDEQRGPSFAAFLDHGQCTDDQRRDGARGSPAPRGSAVAGRPNRATAKGSCTTATCPATAAARRTVR